MPDVVVVEMGPRDGLQNEARQIATEDKIRLVNLLSEVGFSRIETSSFVSPKWVPQLADAGEVFAGIRRREGVRYTALVPNLRGYVAAREAGADEVAVFAAASESFSRRNINCSIAESLTRFAPVLEAAGAEKLPVRGYVSCVTDCPYEGRIAPDAVAGVARALIDLGCYEISLGDTIGHGVPETVAAMLEAVLTMVPPGRLAGHFHDTKGRALDNIKVSLAHGLWVFDAAVAGLGGCPFAPGAAGNVATEAVAAMLSREGYTSGLDPDALARAVEFARSLREGP